MSGDPVVSSLAAIGIGSNLRDPPTQVRRAFEALAELPDSCLLATSSLYRSTPLSGFEQPDFINAAATLETTVEPRALLEEFKAIEQRFGRRRGVRWGPRIIDLDLLVYGDLRIEEPGLRVPHPSIAERNFVLLPLREIAPDLVIPGLGRLNELPVDMNEPAISRL
jgi:2-amino-4-hydroxy-6-hydroxymethyldihydropteridine diphosphokinase